MSENLPTMTLRVAEARRLNPLIRQFRLRAVDGSALPGYTAGAHLRVRVEQLPPTGAMVVSAPLKIKGGSGSPLRVLALVPA